MSVETGVNMSGAAAGVAVGTMSTPIFSGESFSSGATFGAGEGFSNMASMGSLPENGGSFMPGVSAEGLFSEALPLSASFGSIPEIPLKGASEIFSNSDGRWQMIAKGDMPIKTSSDIFTDMGFESVVFDAHQIVNEGPAFVDSVDLANFTKDFNIETKLKASSLNDSDGENVVKLTDGDWEDFENTFLREEFRASVLDNGQESMNPEGLRDTIVFKDSMQAQSSVLERSIESEEKGDKLLKQNNHEEPELARVLLLLDELEKQEKEEDEGEDEDNEKMPKEKKSENIRKRLGFAVDDAAQGNRKSTLKQMVGELFMLARLRAKNKVTSREAMTQIQEKTEHKSQLLFQSGMGNVPDGSFHEVIKEVGELETIDTSLESEIIMRLKVGSIVDAKPAVRMVENVARDLVSEQDVKRVTRFVNSPLSSSAQH